MTAFYQDFTLCSGDHRTLRFAVTDEAGAPVNLGGVQSVRWGCARLLANGSYALPAAIDKTLQTGIRIADASGGIIEVALQSGDTVSLAGRYYHELQMTDAQGAVSTLAFGVIKIIDDLLT
jgi:hypothetical protein